MSDEVSKQFLERLGTEILGTLRMHDVPEEQEYSITSDILFSVTAALDDDEFVSDGQLNINDGLHELVIGFFEDWYQPVNEALDPQRLIFELEIYRELGKPVETNFMAHWLDRTELFQEDLEVALRCRSIDEIDKEIPEKVIERFARRDKRSGNIKEIRVKLPQDYDNENWNSFEFPINEFGEFEHSIEGLVNCILAMAHKYQ